MQTDSRKCAFGHFYYAVTIENPQISQGWKAIEAVHNRFHQMGDKVMEAVKKGNREEARSLYDEGEKLSRQMLELLSKVAKDTQELLKKGVKTV